MSLLRAHIKSRYKTSRWGWHDRKKRDVIFQKTQAALRFLSQMIPGESVLTYRALSLIRAWRTEKSSGSLSTSRVSPSCYIPKYPPFCPDVRFGLVVARFEIQHDAVVNHVCVSKQLCQAESECPLLVRLRPVSLSKSASRVKCYGGTIVGRLPHTETEWITSQP